METSGESQPNLPAERSSPPPSPIYWADPVQRSRGVGLFVRLLQFLLWVVAIGLLTFTGWVVAVRQSIDPDVRLGMIVGAVVGGLLLAMALRAAWLAVRRREGRLSSAWVAVIASFLALGLVTLAVADGLTVPPARDPATLLQIGSEYDFVQPDEETERLVRESFVDIEPQSRGTIIRAIDGEDGSAGVVVVMDLAIPEVLSEVTLEGMVFGARANAEGIAASRQTVGGRQVLVAEGPDGAVVGWVESPLIAMVVAADARSARAMAESMIRASE